MRKTCTIATRYWRGRIANLKEKEVTLKLKENIIEVVITLKVMSAMARKKQKVEGKLEKKIKKNKSLEHTSFVDSFFFFLK